MVLKTLIFCLMEHPACLKKGPSFFQVSVQMAILCITSLVVSSSLLRVHPRYSADLAILTRVPSANSMVHCLPKISASHLFLFRERPYLALSCPIA